MHLFCKINQVSLQHYLFQVELSCILESPTKRTPPLISTVIKILFLGKSYWQKDWFKTDNQTDNQTGYLKQMIWSDTLYMHMTVYVVVNFLSQVILFLFSFVSTSLTLYTLPYPPKKEKQKLPEIKTYLQHIIIISTLFTTWEKEMMMVV